MYATIENYVHNTTNLSIQGESNASKSLHKGVKLFNWWERIEEDFLERCRLSNPFASSNGPKS